MPQRPDSAEPGKTGSLVRASQGETPRVGAGSTGALTRREALERLATLASLVLSSSGAVAAPLDAQGHQHVARRPVKPGVRPFDYRPFFTPGQKSSIARLADLIIPPDDVSPGASEAKGADYIDFVAANSSKEVQRAWVEGLDALDQLSHERAGAPFIQAAPEAQEAMLAEIACRESSPRTVAENFFVRMKQAAAEGFYTSKIGLLDDLKYHGNTFVEAPDTCGDDLEKTPASNSAGCGEPSKVGAPVSAKQH